MASHSWPFKGYLYPPIVKHGLLENPPFISLIFPAINFKLPFIGIVNCHVWWMTHIPSNVHSYPTSINYDMPLSYPIWENNHISLTWIVAATKGDDFPNINHDSRVRENRVQPRPRKTRRFTNCCGCRSEVLSTCVPGREPTEFENPLGYWEDIWGYNQ